MTPAHESCLDGLDIVGVKSKLISSGIKPVSVAWYWLLPDVRRTSPPASRTAPTVVTPTCPCGIDADNSCTDAPSPHSTEIPVTPLGWVEVYPIV
jgi:hypothetical protein